MARPDKIGLEYFTHDCDAAHDEKMESICALYGHHVAYSIIFRLYERIYRSGGKLDISDPSTMRILSRNVAKMTLPHFEKFLKVCQSFEIFDKLLYEEAKLLTSRGIIKRMEPIINKRLRMKELYEKKHAEKTLVSAAETPAETPQKPDRVEKSRVENITTLVDGLAATTKSVSKKTASAATLPARSKYHIAIDLFLKKYNETQGVAYIVTNWGKQTKNIKPVVDSIKPNEYKTALENFFESPKAAQVDYSLDFFISSINTWRPKADE